MLDVENATLLLVAGFYRHVLGLVLDLLSRSISWFWITRRQAAAAAAALLAYCVGGGGLVLFFRFEAVRYRLRKQGHFFGGLCFFVAGDGGI